MGAVVSTIAFPVPDRKMFANDVVAQGQRLVWLKTKGERFPALHFQYPGAQFTLLYSHGNAEDIGISIPYLEEMSRSLQANVFAYEYPGYSISSSKAPSEVLCCQAIEESYNYLTQTCQVDPTTIVLFGRSLGTGPTVDLASKDPQSYPIGGVILQSPLESGIRCVMGPCTSLTLYPLDIFRNYAKIGNISTPVFIVHGEADRVVPCANGRNLYQALLERPHHAEVAYEPLWIPLRGHNDMPLRECLRSFAKFLAFLKERRTCIKRLV